MMTVMKGDELQMMKKMPRGKYLTAMLKMMNEKVPMIERVISVARSSLGMSAKKLSFLYLTMAAEAHILKKERKKTNS